MFKVEVFCVMAPCGVSYNTTRRRKDLESMDRFSRNFIRLLCL